MKKFLIVGGFFLIIIPCISLKRKLAEYNVQKNGVIITAVISYVPVCYFSKSHPIMYFRYNDKTYDKKIWCSFSDNHKKGDTIKLKHIDGADIFLFENEKIEKEFISMVLLALAGLLIMIIGFRKK